MKRFLTTICMLGCLVGMQAQHLKFKGIEMSGTTSSFASQLKAKGMTELERQNGSVLLQGDFASYKQCMIIIVGDEKGSLVKIVVAFPDRDTWSSLYEDFTTLRDLLTAKYGDPAISKEDWSGYKPSSDFSRFSAVEMDNCKYLAAFVTENGEIDLEIAHGEAGCYVLLSYFDNQNQQKVLQQAMEDL